jgi:hypothetical protein
MALEGLKTRTPGLIYHWAIQNPPRFLSLVDCPRETLNRAEDKGCIVYLKGTAFNSLFVVSDESGCVLNLVKQGPVLAFLL